MNKPSFLNDDWSSVRLDEDDRLICSFGRYQLFTGAYEQFLILYDKLLCQSWGMTFIDRDPNKELKKIKKLMRESQPQIKQLALF